MTTSLLRVLLFAFVGVLALDYHQLRRRIRLVADGGCVGKKSVVARPAASGTGAVTDLLARLRSATCGRSAAQSLLGRLRSSLESKHPAPLDASHRRRAMTAGEYAARIAVKRPYQLLHTVDSKTPVRVRQPIHVIAFKQSYSLQYDEDNRSVRIPFEWLTERTLIFEDHQTVAKTTTSVITDLLNDRMCIVILAARNATMRMYLYDVKDKEFFCKITSIYRGSDEQSRSDCQSQSNDKSRSNEQSKSIRLKHATLYIVK